MRCPLCDDIISDTYDGITLHFYHHHPGHRIGPCPHFHDEAEQFRIEGIVAAQTRWLRKKNRPRPLEVELL